MKKTLLLVALAATAMAAFADEPAAEEKHWTRGGNAALQFTQGFVSKNWYKGGESNMALIATGEYNANWKLNRWAWDNKLEAKLGYVTTRSDEFHDYMTNQDLLKLTSKLGYQATKRWYYTLQAMGSTQFCPGYKANTRGEFSKFMNPAYLNIALGMDYKYEKGDDLKFSMFLSPLSYNVKFVGDPLRGWYDDIYASVPSDDATGEAKTVRLPANRGKIDGTQFGLKYGDFNSYDLGASANLQVPHLEVAGHLLLAALPHR